MKVWSSYDGYLFVFLISCDLFSVPFDIVIDVDLAIISSSDSNWKSNVRGTTEIFFFMKLWRLFFCNKIYKNNCKQAWENWQSWTTVPDKRETNVANPPAAQCTSWGRSPGWGTTRGELKPNCEASALLSFRDRDCSSNHTVGHSLQRSVYSKTCTQIFVATLFCLIFLAALFLKARYCKQPNVLQWVSDWNFVYPHYGILFSNKIYILFIIIKLLIPVRS